MNCLQMHYFCGIGSYVTIHLINAKQVKGILISVKQEELEVQTDIGAVRRLKNEDIMDIQLDVAENGFGSPEIMQKVQQLHGMANQLVNSGIFGFTGVFQSSIDRAVNVLEQKDHLEGNELIKLLKDPEEIKRKNLRYETAERNVRAAGKFLAQDRDLCRCICFLLWYGAGCSSEAMAVFTDDLTADGRPRTDALYRQLGIANQLIGKLDAMTVYWLSKYYQEQPDQALDENDLCCSALWLAYLDMCSDLLYYEGLPDIILYLSQKGSAAGYCCAYASLYRLFSRSGRHLLSREAAACLTMDSGFHRLTRTVQELAIYLKSDKDCHCYFAAEAADRILKDCRNQAVVHYFDRSHEYRCGYLYDYTATRHYGYILGYDLMTYFLPSAVISEKRRKEIKKGFDLSQYKGKRTLMEPFVFRAEKSFRRGNNYTVTELL